MINTLFNTTKTAEDYGTKRLFGVGEMPLLDTVNKHYPKITDYYDQMCALKWKETEIDFSQCLIDFEKAPKDMSEMMLKTLSWQWHNDSLAAQAPTTILAPFEPCTEIWETEVEIQSNECLTPDHQVYVEDKGWINIDLLTEFDFILQFNPVTLKFNYVQPSALIVKDYEDDLLYFNSPNFKQKVTKKHRMLVYRFEGKTFKFTHEFILAEDLILSPDLYFITSNSEYPLEGLSYPGTTNVEVETVPYQGKVYCVTVDTGAFVTRLDGVTSITGNCTHGLTYSEIVRMSFKDPSAVLSDILTQQEVYDRSGKIGEVLKNISTFSIELAYKKLHKLDLPSEKEIRTQLILFYFIMLCLERVKFMASFAITFTIVKAGYFLPIGSAVMKICQDELEVHSEYRKEVLKELIKDDLGKNLFEELKPILVEILEEIIDEDITWTNEYIFENNTKPLVGTNSEIICNMVLYFAKDLVNVFKLKTKYTFPKYHPMPHLIQFMDLSKTQMAPMEQDIVSYVTQVINSDDDQLKFDYIFD